ncbi:phosphatidylinositol synthase [Wallemia mellicola CBS 633.66]|uniref:CDP-diacylglycerol--inositol 3-phosphatidyltransferase n=1 Tax=Wallemia mellicola (strain ATCC MYA-4683 / CBS 633.66) TaxID=671144 RepID=I4YG98_WALMC|nr:phosphatidylinositol synthase [Wallemia mellicola CBS 633.66]EIM22990.1 phosphatidylinositol synthase [Wallemia mellicola CBS 633.66]|eukprot:XP_006957030.1 phosphatidylinositol synthase [Wallemia mellicola CBS 633.66]
MPTSKNQKTQKTSRSIFERITQQGAIDLANEQEENIYLFVPNLIGYLRIVFAALAVRSMKDHPKVCAVLYCISAILDVADGMAARSFNQTSKLGGVLDMVTDRCSTTSLMVFLSSAYPDWSTLFQFLIALDFSSHFIHMYASLVTGATSHKLIQSEVSKILWLYYNNRITLFIFCAGNEIFFVALYIIYTSKLPAIGLSAALVHSLVPDVLKQQISAAAFENFTNYVININPAHLVAIVTFPICFTKQVINVVQFWKASKTLVGVDLSERANNRQKKQ